ncbi:MAG: hypothetical protein WD490_01845 [Opitutales bacterium]
MDPLIILFLSLTAAHLLADFVLQTDNDIASKETPAIFAKHILMSFGWGLAIAWFTRYLLDRF